MTELDPPYDPIPDSEYTYPLVCAAVELLTKSARLLEQLTNHPDGPMVHTWGDLGPAYTVHTAVCCKVLGIAPDSEAGVQLTVAFVMAEEVAKYALSLCHGIGIPQAQAHQAAWGQIMERQQAHDHDRSVVEGVDFVVLDAGGEPMTALVLPPEVEAQAKLLGWRAAHGELDQEQAAKEMRELLSPYLEAWGQGQGEQ